MKVFFISKGLFLVIAFVLGTKGEARIELLAAIVNKIFPGEIVPRQVDILFLAKRLVQLSFSAVDRYHVIFQKGKVLSGFSEGGGDISFLVLFCVFTRPG